MSWFLALLCSLGFLAACGGGSNPSPQPPPATIDPAVFLNTVVCADGYPQPLNPGCSNQIQQGATPIVWRRYDWAHADQAQIQDTFKLDDGSGWAATFSYPPHLALNPPNGDGGDFFELKGDRVFISYTQNGNGSGGTVAGWWVGINCGGTSWTSFDRYANETWRSEVAKLKGSYQRDACPSLDSAYTRWRVVKQLPIYFIIQQLDGTITTQTVPLDALVTEHFAGSSMSGSQQMERQIHIAGIGPSVFWEGWVKGAQPATFQCPGVDGWNGPPDNSGWALIDRRCRTVFRQFLPVQTGDQYGWPPAGAAQ